MMQWNWRHAFILACVPLSAPVAAGDCPSGAAVTRALFTAEVAAREPQGALAQLSPGTPAVYFFSEVERADGSEISHTWLLDGRALARVELEVGSPQWRTWSLKTLAGVRAGELQVQVRDADGCLLAAVGLPVGDAGAPPAGDTAERLAPRLREAMEWRRAGELVRAAERLAELLTQVEPELPLHAEMRHELHYHLPLARARAYIDSEAVAELRQELAAVRRYLRGHPREFEYGRIVDSYYVALHRLEHAH